RGGSPNAFDRMLGTNFGACAVRALASGQTGEMVALQAGVVITVPLSEAIANIKTVAPEGQLVRTARDIGISFASALDSRSLKRIFGYSRSQEKITRRTRQARRRTPFYFAEGDPKGS